MKSKLLFVFSVLLSLFVLAGCANRADLTDMTGKATASGNFGYLYVNSTPSGANVSVNGVYKGLTPKTIPLAPGYYTVRVSKTGYLDYVKNNVYIAKKLTTKISVVLSLSCADSDNRDYSTRGTVTGGYNNCLNGQCVDYCSSSAQVVEWYCSDTGYATQEPVSCPYGCTNGACNPTPQQTCTESDGGKVYGVAGTAQVCMGTSCTPYPDSCNGAYVNEYYCAGSNVALDSSHSCDNGCESGACKPAPVVNYN